MFYSLQDAVTVTNCQHNFCDPCLTGWIQRRTDASTASCPRCRGQFSVDGGVENSRLIRNLMAVFKVKCPTEPCEAIMNFSQLTSHSEAGFGILNNLAHFFYFHNFSFVDDCYIFTVTDSGENKKNEF